MNYYSYQTDDFQDDNIRLTPSSQNATSWAQMEVPREVVLKKENESVYRKGGTATNFFKLESGCVKIISERAVSRGRASSSEFISRLVGPGEFFGLTEVIDGVPYRTSAVALRPSHVQIFSKDPVKKILDGPESLPQLFLKQLSKDLMQKEESIQLHYLASVQERIAYQLVILADRFGVQVDNGISLQLKLTRNELAQLAGTINESLSRHLTEFKRDGLIDLHGKEIIIKDRAALAARSRNFN